MWNKRRQLPALFFLLLPIAQTETAAAYFANEWSQVSPILQGGARVLTDDKPLFEKSGWKNSLIFKELKISSLEWRVYKKIAACGVT